MKRRNGRPRRPGPVHLNAIEIAMKRSQRLSAADVAMQQATAKAGIEGLRAGAGLAVLAHPVDGDEACLTHWKSLADVANMAETMAGMGLGAGDQADTIIEAAQTALHEVFLRRQIMGVWSLTAEQADALEWLAALHCGTQLPAASYGEFERAMKRTTDRMRGALSGNAAPGTVVVTGQIGEVANA